MFRRRPKIETIDVQPVPEPLPEYIAQLTGAQEQELRALLAQHVPDVAFPLLAGLVCGLTVTDNAAPRKALMLLDVENVPEALRDLLHLYEADVDSAVLAGCYAPPEEVFTDPGSLTQWMSGVGLAVQLDPAKFMFIMVGPPELKAPQMIAFTFLAFAPQDAAAPNVAPDMLPALDDLQPELTRSRGHFTRQWEHEPDDERRALIGDMVTELRVGYALATAVQDNLNGPHQGLREGLAGRPRPVRREGRKIMPNEPCPCGSGKKYKKCHGAPGAPPLPEGV